MMLPILFLLLECQSVTGDAILGRDLAAADARFAAIPADERLGYAPLPGGLHRTMAAAEVGRIAGRFGISGEFHEACFEYRTRQLQTGDIQDATRAGLGIADANVQIVDFSRYAAPGGDLVFPIGALARPSLLHPDEPVLWRGYIKYGGARRFTIWAKVRIEVTEPRIFAAQDLPAAQQVQPSQLELRMFTGFPAAQPVARTLEQVAGHALRRAIKAGSPIWLDAVEAGRLAANYDVGQGELVDVEVEAGMARLKFEARAESSGTTGETVRVRNTKSGRMFTARVAGKGKVALTTGMVNE